MDILPICSNFEGERYDRHPQTRGSSSIFRQTHVVKRHDTILVSIWDVSLLNVGIVYPMYQVDVHFTYVICTRLVYYPS